jgi:hypothetical protein
MSDPGGEEKTPKATARESSLHKNKGQGDSHKINGGMGEWMGGMRRRGCCPGVAMVGVAARDVMPGTPILE